MLQRILMYMLQITLWRDCLLSTDCMECLHSPTVWTSKCGWNLHPFTWPSSCITIIVNSIPLLEILQFVFLALLVHLCARERRVKQAHLNLDQSNSLLILKKSVPLCWLLTTELFIVVDAIKVTLQTFASFPSLCIGKVNVSLRE